MKKDLHYEDIACIIMASGLGKRFGENKLMAQLHGKKMIEYILEATDDLFEKRIVVTRHDNIVQYCKQRGVECILHDKPYRSDTVRIGIEAVDNATHAMFCQADQPLVSQESIIKLCDEAIANSDKMTRLSYKGQPGAPVIFPKSKFEELKHLPEGKGGNVVIKKYPEQVVLVPARDEYELWDIDTQDDFQKINSLLVMEQ